MSFSCTKPRCRSDVGFDGHVRKPEKVGARSLSKLMRTWPPLCGRMMNLWIASIHIAVWMGPPTDRVVGALRILPPNSQARRPYVVDTKAIIRFQRRSNLFTAHLLLARQYQVPPLPARTTYRSKPLSPSIVPISLLSTLLTCAGPGPLFRYWRN